MKKKLFRIIFTLIMVHIIMIGCSSTSSDRLVPTASSEIYESTSIEAAETLEETIQKARFTISAEADLEPAILALYEGFFEGESPFFVASGADLIATSTTSTFNERPIVQATFLPGSVLISENENDDIISFIKFAVSPEGQQVLIDIGELPAFITLTDQAGNILEIQQPVRRIISAFGPATSIIYTVNAQDRLVAASFTGANDPQGASVMERIDPRFPSLVGDDYFSRSEFNLEQAATLEPDVIIASARSAWLETVDQLGIKVFQMDAETPLELKEAVLLMSQLFGPHAYAQAQAWVAYYDWIIDTVDAQLGEIPLDGRPQVLFTGTEPLRVASGEMYQTDIIKAAGGISVSAGLSGYWNDVNLEQVAIWDPNIIIVPPYGGATVEAITESTEWQILEAVQDGHVYRMPRLVVPWDTPAPDSVMGIVWMAGRLNPDQIELDCGTEAAYFYSTFLDYAITGDEIAAVCGIE